MKERVLERITVPSILQRKAETPVSKKITALTAYDYTMARLLDRAGIDILLVGDSLGTVVQGQMTTLPVTLEEMIYHSRCVSRAVSHALVVGDLPFLTYQASVEQAVYSAGKLLKEGGVAAVKLEGGLPMQETIRRLSEIDVPVMGHIGLTPQSYHRMGGYKVQGKTEGSAAGLEAGTRKRIIEDALAVQNAGAFSVVIEGVPADLAAEITAMLHIPTIGIGAGAGCDGQILVINDMLGLNPDFSPRFVKRYAEIGSEITRLAGQYADEVRCGVFPAEQHSFSGRQSLKVAK